MDWANVFTATRTAVRPNPHRSCPTSIIHAERPVKATDSLTGTIQTQKTRL